MSANNELLATYQAMIAAGDIHADKAQAHAVDLLCDLNNHLATYSTQMGKTGWRQRLKLGGGRKSPPRGLYMWGGVGRGKSMLMDMFFEHAQVEEADKKHVHFHAFLQEVHRRVHAFREAQKAGKMAESKDPLLALSKVIVDQAWLLCFDEFHVTDIADAMILGRLFESLFDQGVVVVATSNRHPKDLYKDGLQRDRFLPFIDIFLDKMAVMELDSDTDYRLDRLRDLDAFLSPLGADTEAQLEASFISLTRGERARAVTLNVNGRELNVPKVADGVAYTSFKELCEQPLGPGDFLEIAGKFHTLMMSGIPKLGPEKRNEAKRFVTLIDALYEAKVKFICTAAASPTELYTEGDGAFEFERTVSRLMEMQSPEYIATPHQG